ncbi:DUF4347 domain-containing protein [Synechococcus sp. AH-601-L23]|nr:DUF4347 domain-containing protein [Synechococcus sp. AH-601-L23]
MFQLTTAACSEKTSHLLVASSGCPEIQALIAGARIPRSPLPAQKPPLRQITSVLNRRAELRHPVGTLHLLAHGRPGAFRFGNQWIDTEALKAHANELASWGVETIALWSCHVGADANFVALLEELTGAQVLASAEWLGRDGVVEQTQLGDWQLSDLVDEMAWPSQFRLEGLGDELIGSDTADELSGGQGDDSLTGGAGRDDFELSDGNDLILDFEDDVDVISVRSYKDLSLEQAGDDVLISRGDQQTRVLNSTVNVVADSLVRIDARLENNRGQKQWKQMQRQLNKALDSIAARSDNPAEPLQVEVMAMGESSDADFPAIYADLFRERTFDNRKGGWSYEVFNSFGLPDFLG